MTNHIPIAQLRKMMMPRIRAKTWSFPEKKDPDKIWHAWTIEVFMRDRNNMPVVMHEFNSHTMQKPRLFKTELSAKKDLADWVDKISASIKRGFGDKQTGALDLKSGSFRGGRIT